MLTKIKINLSIDRIIEMRNEILMNDEKDIIEIKKNTAELITPKYFCEIKKSFLIYLLNVLIWYDIIWSDLKNKSFCDKLKKQYEYIYIFFIHCFIFFF